MVDAVTLYVLMMVELVLEHLNMDIKRFEKLQMLLSLSPNFFRRFVVSAGCEDFQMEIEDH